MASTKLILKLNKKNKQGEAPIYLRVIHNRKAQFYCLDIYINPKYWDEKHSKVRKSHKNAKWINAHLLQKMADGGKLALAMANSAAPISKRKGRRIVLGRSEDDFIGFADDYLENLKAKEKLGSHDKAKAVLDKLKAKCGEGELKFYDITVEFLKKYEAYLRDELKNKPNTIHSNMKVIRRIINEAVKEDVIEYAQNPFLRYKLKWENVQKSFLTEEDLVTLEEYNLVEGSMKWHHRNMYIFACYAGGMRISDVLQLKWENFDGERVLLKTQKTGSVVSIKLPQRAIEIINLYKTEESKKEHFIFPILKNDIDYSNAETLFNSISSATAYTNTDLKDISKDSKLFKPLNFHTARHTWATRALKKGMRIEYVSKLMGHASIKTTQVYAKIVNEDLDKAMEVFDAKEPEVQPEQVQEK